MTTFPAIIGTVERSIDCYGHKYTLVLHFLYMGSVKQNNKSRYATIWLINGWSTQLKNQSKLFLEDLLYNHN
jgi:hypothetical protein